MACRVYVTRGYLLDFCFTPLGQPVPSALPESDRVHWVTSADTWGQASPEIRIRLQKYVLYAGSYYRSRLQPVFGDAWQKSCGARSREGSLEFLDELLHRLLARRLTVLQRGRRPRSDEEALRLWGTVPASHGHVVVATAAETQHLGSGSGPQGGQSVVRVSPPAFCCSPSVTYSSHFFLVNWDTLRGY